MRLVLGSVVSWWQCTSLGLAGGNCPKLLQHVCVGSAPFCNVEMAHDAAQQLGLTGAMRHSMWLLLIKCQSLFLFCGALREARQAPFPCFRASAGILMAQRELTPCVLNLKRDTGAVSSQHLAQSGTKALRMLSTTLLNVCIWSEVRDCSSITFV